MSVLIVGFQAGVDVRAVGVARVKMARRTRQHTIDEQVICVVIGVLAIDLVGMLARCLLRPFPKYPIASGNRASLPEVPLAAIAVGSTQLYPSVRGAEELEPHRREEIAPRRR